MTKLSQYKILHRTHITQHILNKMGLCDSDICPQCTQVTQKLEILQPGLEKSLSPHMYVLNDITSISRPNKQAKPTFTALAITKKTILVRDKTNWYKFETSYNQQRLLPHLNTPPPKRACRYPGSPEVQIGHPSTQWSRPLVRKKGPNQEPVDPRYHSLRLHASFLVWLLMKAVGLFSLSLIFPALLM